MQISKMVPVTIEVQDDNPNGCSSACWFNYDDDLCEKYNEPILSCRNARCLAEFGTGLEGEKMAEHSHVELVDCPVCKGRGRWEFRPNNWIPCQTCRRTGAVEVAVREHPSSEFGTGEKPKVVSWEESKAGDVVEVKNQLYVINYSKSPRDACEKCCLNDIPYCKGETEDSWCCYDHPSGCHVYFTEVEESPKQPPNP